MENIVCCCYLFSGLFCFVLRQGVTSPDWPATGNPPAPASLGLELKLNHHASVIFLFFVFFFKFQHPTEISLKFSSKALKICLMDKHRHEKMLTDMFCHTEVRSLRLSPWEDPQLRLRLADLGKLQSASRWTFQQGWRRCAALPRRA